MRVYKKSFFVLLFIPTVLYAEIEQKSVNFNSSGRVMRSGNVELINSIGQGVIGAGVDGTVRQGIGYIYTLDNVPDMPSALGPAGYVIGSWTNNNLPVMDWTQTDPDIGDLLKFRIQVSSWADYSFSFVDYTSSMLVQGATDFVCPLLSDGTYYWRVRSIDPYNEKSAWAFANGGNIAFRIDTALPEGINPVSPVDGSYVNTSTPVFNWSESTDTLSGINGYLMQVSGDDNFGVLAYSSETVRSGLIPDIINDGAYYWRVRAKDNAGNYSVWSASWSIIIDTTPPNMLSTTLLTPNGGGTWQAGDTRNITWTALDITDINLPANPITLYYSTDSGNSWTMISSNEANDGIYSWNIPQMNFATCRVKIEAQDLAGNRANDASDADFTIGQPNLTILPTTLTAQKQGGGPNPNLKITAEIQNNGLGTASGVPVSFLSNTLAPSPQETSVANLGAGNTSTKFVTFDWPDAGIWDITVAADPDNSITEVNEADNSVTANIVTDPNAVISVGDYSSHPAFENVLIRFSKILVFGNGGWNEILAVDKYADFAYLHKYGLRENIGYGCLENSEYVKIKLVLDRAEGVKTGTGEKIEFELPEKELEIEFPFEIVRDSITEIAIHLNLTTSIMQTETGWRFTPMLLFVKKFIRTFETGLEAGQEYTLQGHTAQYNVTVKNTGDIKDAYELYLAGDIPEQWVVHPSSFTLEAKEEKTVLLSINVPRDIPESGKYPFEMVVMPQKQDPLVIYGSRSSTGELNIFIDSITPAIELVSPSEDSEGMNKLAGLKQEIIGSIYDLHLDYYEVSYAVDVSTIWTVIEKGYENIKENKICEWGTTGLAEGWYKLKIYAVDKVKNETAKELQLYIGTPEAKLVIGTKGNGPGELNLPSYITIDKDENIWVSDTNNDRINKYTKDGEFLLSIKDTGKMLVSKQGKKTVETPDLFNKPAGLGVDSQNRVYLTDRNNDRVLVFTSSGGYVSIENTGLKNYGFNKPHGVFIDKEDRVYVADRNNNTLAVFDENLDLIREIGTGVETGDLNKPQGGFYINNTEQASGMQLLSEDRIYITDRNNDRVVVLSSTGAYITEISTGLNKPDGICADFTGYMFTADTNNDSIKRYNVMNRQECDLRAFEIAGRAGSFNKPGGIIQDSFGNLYVVDSNNSRVIKLGLPDKIKQTKSVAAPVIIQPIAHSIADFVAGEIYIFPNPAKNGKSPVLHIEAGIADRVEIKIYDIAAELVHEAVLVDRPGIVADRYAYEYPWNTNDIASGVYICYIEAKKDGKNPIRAIKKTGVIK